MITEEERVKMVEERVKMAEAFAAVGYGVQDMDRALKALANAFAPRRRMLTAEDFSGLEGRLLAIDEVCEWEGNHPDGWYRKFSNKSKPLKACPRGSLGGQKFLRHRWR